MQYDLESAVSKLSEWAGEGALGWFEANEMEQDIISDIARLRARIDELGGYSDDI
jgi:hypothetical protein